MKPGKLIFTAVLFFLFLNGCKKEEEVITPVIVEPVENNIILTEPANNSTIDVFTPLLKWDQFQNSNSYFVQLSMDANFVTPNIVDTAINGTQINVPPGKLTTNINYYWRIKADLGSENFSNWSRSSKFKIILAPPLPPELLLPPDNSIDQSFLPVFDWTDALNTDYYRLQVSTNPDFTPVLIDSNHIPISTLQAPYFYITTGTNYYWRVNGTNSNGVSTGNWSTVFKFRTIDGITPSSVSGTVKFTDNNFVNPPFYYVISAFKTNRWPPELQAPDYNDSLDIQFINNEYVANYTLRNVENGNYHLAVYSTTRSLSLEYVYKSVYGCDTSRVEFSSCPLTNPGTVTMTNGIGIININMLSWADSNKTIF